MGSSAEWECSAEHSWWNSDLENEGSFLYLRNGLLGVAELGVPKAGISIF